ncbi:MULTISPECIES: DNA-binding protein [Enterobacter]|uniref:DNA-binding protein n=1 Tax=Enterobacter TaxID=547 RepID=UPI001F561266|nr:DNA-binding protein [Enterobacter sp. I4]MCI2293872.1 DNA-binding protein [Enterobacter sp. I4]MCM7511291.1 DNA-binding protein [Enterobacter hormaechei]
MIDAEYEPKQVIDAGIALQSEGRNVTGFALRNRIGGGNPGTLKQVWDEYQTSHSSINVNSGDGLPVEVAEEVKTVAASLTERIVHLATELNNKAVRAAERRVSEVTRAAGEQTAQAERELADAAQTVEELEEKLREAFSENTWLAQSLESERLLSRQRGMEINQLKERVQAQDQTIRQREETTEKLVSGIQESLRSVEQTLQQERQSYENNLTGMRLRLDQAAEKERQLTSELKRARNEQVTLAAKLESHESIAKEQIHKLNQELARSQEKANKLELSRAEARKEVSDVREQLAFIRRSQIADDSPKAKVSYEQKAMLWEAQTSN